MIGQGPVPVSGIFLAAINAVPADRYAEFVTAQVRLQALGHLQRGNIAPVTCAGGDRPGDGGLHRYAKVLDAEGKPLVRRPRSSTKP